MGKRPVDRVLHPLIHLLGAFGAAAGKEPPAVACQEESVEVGAKTKTVAGGEGAEGGRRVRLRAALRQRLSALRRARRRQPLGRALRRALAAQRIAAARRFRAQGAAAWAAAERAAAAALLERGVEVRPALPASAFPPVISRAGLPAAAAGGGTGSSESPAAGGGASGSGGGSGHSGGSGSSGSGAGGGAGGGGGGPTQTVAVLCGESPAQAVPAVTLRILAAGQNYYGQCGVPRKTYTMLSDEPPILTPVFASGLQPPQGAEIAKICLGENFLLVLTAQGAVLHAGANHMGQRGDGQDEHYETHEELYPVPLHCSAVDIACGGDHAAAVLSNRAVSTWGANGYGQLGRAGQESGDQLQEWERTPGVVESIAELERVFAGDTTTFFLSRGGEVAACGSNNRGELCLGDAGEVVVRRPQRVAALCGRRITQLQGGLTHCIMLEADGSVWVWGDMNGRLADGSALWSAGRGCVPIRLAAGPAVCVAAGWDFCAAVTAAEGSLLLWGGNFAEQPFPVQLPGDQSAAAVVCGAHSVWARSGGGEWVGFDWAYRQPFGPGEATAEEEEDEEEEREFRLRPISEAGLSKHCVPLCGSSSFFALYLEGRSADQISRRAAGFACMPGVLRVAGRELLEEDLAIPLSDVGVSAECVVRLLRVPRLPSSAGRAGCQGATGLAVYVDATLFGVTDHICLEVHPDATVLNLVAAAAEHLGLGG